MREIGWGDLFFTIKSPSHFFDRVRKIKAKLHTSLWDTVGILEQRRKKCI
jgi:hypothetical protein